MPKKFKVLSGPPVVGASQSATGGGSVPTDLLGIILMLHGALRKSRPFSIHVGDTNGPFATKARESVKQIDAALVFCDSVLIDRGHSTFEQIYHKLSQNDEAEAR